MGIEGGGGTATLNDRFEVGCALDGKFGGARLPKRANMFGMSISTNPRTSRNSCGSTELAEVLPAPFRARVFDRPFFGLDLRQTGPVLELENLITQ
jgi:hypothetical protein